MEQVPADPQALFKIASISKLYIATTTVMLVNDGVLSLGYQSITRYDEDTGTIFILFVNSMGGVTHKRPYRSDMFALSELHGGRVRFTVNIVQHHEPECSFLIIYL
ncbi:MAG: hypothetical protein RLP44_21400 [Aggregatilineales bacterium]